MELCRQYGRPFAAASANQLLDKHLGKQENPRRCMKIWQRYYAEQQTQWLAMMVSRAKPIKWHMVDSAAAQILTSVTNSPGVVYPMTTRELPQTLQNIPGVSSYYVSGYTSGQCLPKGFNVRGELVVARADGPLTKNYQFVFATSSEGQVYFTGPFKGFGHHVSSGQQVSVDSLFNQTPFSPKR